MGVFENLTDIEVEVQSGNAAILELPPIESDPTPDVTWSTLDGRILYDIKYATSHNKLLILNASDKDERSFRARATNKQIGKEENGPVFNLKVVGDPDVEIAPSIIIAPTDMQIVKDRSVTYLDCIANARYLLPFLSSF